MRFKIIWVGSVLVAFAVGMMVTSAFAIGGNTGQVETVASNSSGVSNASQANSQTSIDGIPTDPAEEIVIGVYKKLAPSVVHITATKQTWNPFYGAVPQEGTGSGVIIDEKGYILTNNHVIKDANEVTITFSDGSIENAALVGIDQFTDLAVVKVEKAIDPSWVAELGDSDVLRVGQRAIAIGNPFGFDQTLSVGVISALGRPVKTPEAEYDDMIQSDAAINPGNSGGPLIDSHGKVIGLTTSIFSKTGTSLGIGFAIPSNSCSKVAQDIIAFGRVRRPYLGVNGFPLNPDLSRIMNLTVGQGVLVQSVVVGSPAEKAGLRAGTEQKRFQIGRYILDIILGGDIILSIDGEGIFNQQQLNNTIKKKAPGDIVKLGVLRDGQSVTVDVTLEMEP